MNRVEVVKPNDSDEERPVKCSKGIPEAPPPFYGGIKKGKIRFKWNKGKGRPRGKKRENQVEKKIRIVDT